MWRADWLLTGDDGGGDVTPPPPFVQSIKLWQTEASTHFRRQLCARSTAEYIKLYTRLCGSSDDDIKNAVRECAQEPQTTAKPRSKKATVSRTTKSRKKKQGGGDEGRTTPCTLCMAPPTLAQAIAGGYEDGEEAIRYVNHAEFLRRLARTRSRRAKITPTDLGKRETLQLLVDCLIPPAVIARLLLVDRSCSACVLRIRHRKGYVEFVRHAQKEGDARVEFEYTKLASPSPETRAEVERALAEMRPSALPPLPGPDLMDDPTHHEPCPLRKDPYYWLGGEPLSETELAQVLFECARCKPVMTPYSVPVQVVDGSSKACRVRIETDHAIAARLTDLEMDAKLHYRRKTYEGTLLETRESTDPGYIIAQFSIEEGQPAFSGSAGDNDEDDDDATLDVRLDPGRRFIVFQYQQERIVDFYGNKYAQPFVARSCADPYGHTDLKRNVEGYQQGVVDRFAHPTQRSMLVNHYMGTGKTLTALITMLFLSTQRVGVHSFIVVAPDSILTEWANEISDWNLPQSFRDKLYIYSYTQALDWETQVPEHVRRVAADSMFVLDEAHRLTEAMEHAEDEPIFDREALERRENIASLKKKWIDFTQIVQESKRLMLLTGTPVYRSTMDLAYLINLLSQNAIGQNLMPTDQLVFNQQYMTLDEQKRRSRQLGDIAATKGPGWLLGFGAEIFGSGIDTATGTAGFLTTGFAVASLLKIGLANKYMESMLEPSDTVVWYKNNRPNLLRALRPYVDYYDLADFRQSQSKFPWKKFKFEKVPYTAHQLIAFSKARLASMNDEDMRELGMLDPRVMRSDYVSEGRDMSYEDEYTCRVVLLRIDGQPWDAATRKKATTDHLAQIRKMIGRKMSVATDASYVKLEAISDSDAVSVSGNAYCAFKFHAPTALAGKVTIGSLGLYDPAETKDGFIDINGQLRPIKPSTPPAKNTTIHYGSAPTAIAPNDDFVWNREGDVNTKGGAGPSRYSSETFEIVVAPNARADRCNRAYIGPIVGGKDVLTVDDVRRYMHEHGASPHSITEKEDWRSDTGYVKEWAEKTAEKLKAFRPRFFDVEFVTAQEKQRACSIEFMLDPCTFLNKHAVDGVDERLKPWSNERHATPIVADTILDIVDMCVVRITPKFEALVVDAELAAADERVTKKAGTKAGTKKAKNKGTTKAGSKARKTPKKKKAAASSRKKTPTKRKGGVARSERRAHHWIAHLASAVVSRAIPTPMSHTTHAADPAKPFVPLLSNSGWDDDMPFVFEATTKQEDAGKAYFTCPIVASSVVALAHRNPRTEHAQQSHQLRPSQHESMDEPDGGRFYAACGYRYDVQHAGEARAMMNAASHASEDRLRSVYQKAHAKAVNTDAQLLRIGNLTETRYIEGDEELQGKALTFSFYPPKWQLLWDNYLQDGAATDSEDGAFRAMKKHIASSVLGYSTESTKIVSFPKKRSAADGDGPPVPEAQSVTYNRCNRVVTRYQDDTPENQRRIKKMLESCYGDDAEREAFKLEHLPYNELANKIRAKQEEYKQVMREKRAKALTPLLTLLSPPTFAEDRANKQKRAREGGSRATKQLAVDKKRAQGRLSWRSYPRAVVYSQFSDGGGGLYQFKQFLMREKNAAAYIPSSIKGEEGKWATMEERDGVWREVLHSEPPEESVYRIALMDRLIGAQFRFAANDAVTVRSDGKTAGRRKGDWPAVIIHAEEGRYTLRVQTRQAETGKRQTELWTDVAQEDLRTVQAGNTGSQNVNAREAFNEGKIDCVLIHYSITEGISFKCVRQIHMLEPIANPAAWEQVIARAARNQSHDKLEPEDRYVQVVTWMCVVPGDKGVVHDVSPTIGNPFKPLKFALASGSQLAANTASSLSAVTFSIFGVEAKEKGRFDRSADVFGNGAVKAFASMQQSREYEKAIALQAKEWAKALPMTPYQLTDMKLATSPDLNILKICNNRMQDVDGLKSMMSDLYASSPMMTSQTRTGWKDSRETYDGKARVDSAEVTKVREENRAVYKNMLESAVQLYSTTEIDTQQDKADAKIKKMKTQKKKSNQPPTKITNSLLL